MSSEVQGDEDEDKCGELEEVEVEEVEVEEVEVEEVEIKEVEVEEVEGRGWVDGVQSCSRNSLRVHREGGRQERLLMY